MSNYLLILPQAKDLVDQIRHGADPNHPIRCVELLADYRSDDCALLYTLQCIVDGFIEIVRPRGMTRPYVMVCDEEGALKPDRENRFNPFASAFYGAPIYGTVVVCMEILTTEGPDLAPLGPEDVADWEMSCGPTIGFLGDCVRWTYEPTIGFLGDCIRRTYEIPDEYIQAARRPKNKRR